LVEESLGQVTTKKNTRTKKTQEKPQGHYPAVPPPLGVQKILWSLKIQALAYVAKDATSMFGRAKTGGLGQVTTKKNVKQEKPQGH